MTPLQQITCSPEQILILSEIYAENQLHELRQRGHIIILRHKGYNLDEICSVLGKDKWNVVIIIKAFFHFGFEGLSNLNYEDLIEKIRQIEESVVQPIKLDFWVQLNKFFKSVFRFLLFGLLCFMLIKGWELFNLSSTVKYYALLIIPLLPIGWFTFWLTQNSWLQSEKLENQQKNKAENYLNFIGSGNTINQTNNQFILNLSGKESQIANLPDFIEGLRKSSNTSLELKSNDSRVLKLLRLIQKYKNNKVVKNIIIIFGGAAVYWSIKYGATVKGGFLLFSIFCIQFTVTTLSEKEAIVIQKSSNNEKLVISRDTILSTPSLPNQEEQLDFSKILVSDEHEYLIDVQNQDATKFMKQDSINHWLEYYLINGRDGKAYLQVASYRDIKYAAIQRKNLIENHHFNEHDCKILYSNNFGEFLFGVTIGDGERDNIEALSKIQNDWNLRAKSYNVRAFLKTN